MSKNNKSFNKNIKKIGFTKSNRNFSCPKIKYESNLMKLEKLAQGLNQKIPKKFLFKKKTKIFHF
jgi:hypothetical protein